MNNLFKVYAEERGTIFIYTPQNSGNNGIRNRHANGYQRDPCTCV
jgi:hypothetical protein